MPQVIRGIRSHSDGPRADQSDTHGLDHRRVTFDHGQTRTDSLNALSSTISDHNSPPNRSAITPLPSSHNNTKTKPKKTRRSSNRDRHLEEGDAYYDSRAA